MKRIFVLAAIAGMFAVTSCGQAEKKEESNTEKEAQELMDEMDEKAEEVSDAADEAVEKTEEAAEGAVDAVENAADSAKTDAEEVVAE